MIEYAKAIGANEEVLNWCRTTLAATLKAEPKDQGEVEHILDYLVSDSAPRRLRRMSYDQARIGADKWTKANQKRGRDLIDGPEDIKVLHDFADGSKIVQLLTAKAYQREGFYMAHCFHKETRVITDLGVLPIDQVSLRAAKILTKHPTKSGRAKFVQAEVRSFGEQELMRVTLQRNGKRHEILATRKHRWFFKEGYNKNKVRVRECTTDQLVPGYRLPYAYTTRVLTKAESDKGVQLSPIGILHGATFGDGTARAGRYANLELVGHKQVLLDYVADTYRVTQNSARKSTTIHDLPNYFKSLPSLDENASYLMGFLAGLIATDGAVDANGNVSISNKSSDTLERIQAICIRLGIRTTGIYTQSREGFGLDREISLLRLSVGALPDDMLLNAHHKERNREAQTSLEWVVVSVEETGIVDTVYCAVVPETGAFVLDHGILTGNCVGGYDPKTSTIYSYRDENNEPHATFEVSRDGGSINQIKGKGNGPIHPKYIEPILTFLDCIGQRVRPSEMSNLGYIHVPEVARPILESVVDSEGKGPQYIHIRGEAYVRQAL